MMLLHHKWKWWRQMEEEWETYDQEREGGLLLCCRMQHWMIPLSHDLLVTLTGWWCIQTWNSIHSLSLSLSYTHTHTLSHSVSVFFSLSLLLSLYLYATHTPCPDSEDWLQEEKELWPSLSATVMPYISRDAVYAVYACSAYACVQYSQLEFLVRQRGGLEVENVWGLRGAAQLAVTSSLTGQLVQAGAA